MSAWRVGSEVAAAPEADQADAPVAFGGPVDADGAPAGHGVQEVVDRLTKWIPGDVIALYVAAVTALHAGHGSKPSPVLLILFILLAPGFVVGAAFAATGEVRRSVMRPAVLAAIAFGIWSLSVPLSGWERWRAVTDNRAAVAIVAAIAGVFFGFIADGLAKRAAH